MHLLEPKIDFDFYGLAAEHVTADEVLRLLDYPAFFDLLERPLPADRNGILEALADDGLIRSCEAGDWDITNLGAVLFAKRLDDFRSVQCKSMRVIKYRGTARVETLKEQVEDKGYASGFERLIGFIDAPVPHM